MSINHPLKPGPLSESPNRNTKRQAILSWLRGLFVAAALAVATPPAWGGDIRVGFINPTGPPEFWRQVSATMRAAAAELGIDVDERHTQRSFDKAIALARDFVSQRPRVRLPDRHQ